MTFYNNSRSSLPYRRIHDIPRRITSYHPSINLFHVLKINALAAVLILLYMAKSLPELLVSTYDTSTIWGKNR